MTRAAPSALWMLAAGALAALAQAPVSASGLYALGLSALLLFTLHSPTRAWRAGWLWGAGYFALTLHWIVEPFLVDIARHGWMAPFALILMAGGMALFPATGMWLGARLSAGRGRLVRALGLAAGLAAMESARAFILTGFPWADAAQALIDTPMALLLPLGGPRLVTIILLLILAVIAGTTAPRRASLLGAGFAVLLWALPGLPLGPVSTDAPMVRIIQPNAPQDQKWDPAHIPTFFERQLSLTAQPPEADLIVWPEMAVPWALESRDPVLERISFAAKGAPVVLGLPRLETPRYFNSLLVVSDGGIETARYDKRHLVPFGEYIPLGALAGRFGLHGLAARDGGGYSAGTGPLLVDLPGIGPARPLICYEGLFAEEVAPRGMARPRVLLLITNDAWFGGFSGPYQHLDQDRLRAIEQGLPMVRAANTGVSAMIDAHGHVTGQLGLNVAGRLDLPLPAARPAPPYSRWGEIPALIILIAVAGAAFSRRRSVLN